MIKYLFILINSVSLIIFSFFSGEGIVIVSSNIPETIKTGEEIAVEIKINKEEVAGFAKYQMQLPEGFSIKPIDNLGSEFTADGQTVKWVWASLPEENEMTIKFLLTVNESGIGQKSITSGFHYIEFNEKKMIEVPAISVNVIKGDAQPVKPQQEPVATNAIVDTVLQKVNPESHAEPNGNIELVRRISHPANANGEYTLTIKIKKGNTKGFARYSDDITDGITAKSLKTDGGSFSVADGKLKFVWVNVPEKDELEIAYTLSGPTINAYRANGEYSYLEANQSKKVKLEPEGLNMQEAPKEEVIASVSKDQNAVVENETKELNPAKEVTPAKEINAETQVNPDKQVAAETKPKEETSPKQIEKKEGRANYHIQIGAFTNSKVSASLLKNKFKIEENINSEMQGGFSKFMIGDYIDYKKARDKRENVKESNGVKSAFVVAYNDGKRITVQEALMISNQKWFK